MVTLTTLILLSLGSVKLFRWYFYDPIGKARRMIDQSIQEGKAKSL